MTSSSSAAARPACRPRSGSSRSIPTSPWSWWKRARKSARTSSPASVHRSDRPRQAAARLARGRRRGRSRCRSPRTTSTSSARPAPYSCPTFLMPPLMNNHGNFVGSLGNRLPLAGREGGRARRRNLSGLRRGGSALRRQRRSGRRRHRRHGRWSRRQAEGLLYARHGAARQIHAVRRGRARLAEQADHRQIPSRRGPRAAEIRHRHQGTVADRPGETPAGPGAAHVRLAARQPTPAAVRSSITSRTIRSPSASSCISTTRTRRCRRSTSSSASRRIR